MSCISCAELCVSLQVRTSGELRKAVSIVAANVADGTLNEVTQDLSTGSTSVTFAQIAETAEWPDVLNFWFECSNCGERFSLQVETYHGSGGCWQPARTGAIREDL